MIQIKKISKLIDEMTTFYLENDANNITFGIRVRKEGVYIESSAEHINLTEEELRKIEENINTQNREAEMEEYYWKLAGEGPSSEKLSLVAIMVDTAGVSIDRENDRVYINLFRKTVR